MGDLKAIECDLARVAKQTKNHPDGYFINPYNFVPLPECEPDRGEPKGHLSRSGLHSGRLEITYTAVTPLTFDGDNREGSAAAPIQINGKFQLAGSSIAGPVRALHETLTGSCLRVLDTEFVPIYGVAGRGKQPRTGQFSVGERVRSFRPCTDPRLLCPSCATFGMADESGAREGPARQDSYAGHVRFGWGLISCVDSKPTLIRPMGQPRPGSGQFYLDNDRAERREVPPNKGARPLREWGSEADTGFGEKKDRKSDKPETPREIRGRKRFWANSIGGTSAGPARHYGEPPDPGKEMAATERRLVPKGATVTAWVTFDALDKAQLGALIVALSPNVLSKHLPWPDDTKPTLVSHLGGGKGIGLGVVSSEITKLELHTEHRYERADLTAQQADVKPYVERFIQVTSDEVMATWPALLAMLSLDHVPAELVEYPPDENGLVGSRSGSQPFSFDFWKKSQGRGRPMLVLPEADSEEPAIEWAKPKRKPTSGIPVKPADRSDRDPRPRNAGAKNNSKDQPGKKHSGKKRSGKRHPGPTPGGKR